MASLGEMRTPVHKFLSSFVLPSSLANKFMVLQTKTGVQPVFCLATVRSPQGDDAQTRSVERSA